MMQGPLAGIMPGGGSVAVGTGTFFSRARPFFDGWCWQIVGMHKFFGRVWLILTGAGHVMIPLEFKVKTDNLPDFSVFVNVNSPILLLQSRKSPLNQESKEAKEKIRFRKNGGFYFS
jgi:hypothetical protein